MLKMPLFLLDCATSNRRDKQSILLRDLKLGINHVDRDQLRRNGIYKPRYPTILKQLKINIEDAVEDDSGNTILYKIRCTAVTEYIGVHIDDSCDVKEDGTSPEYGDIFHEEWSVWRSFRDVASLHRMLKSIVHPSQSSAGAGAKLVGAATGLASAATGLATAALPFGNSNTSSSVQSSTPKREVLVPSLSQAAKAGALGETKKSIEKRKQVLIGYFRHLLAPNNLLNRCPELLRFVGAYDPLPIEIKLNQGVIPDFSDNLGRTEMKKILLQSTTLKMIIGTNQADQIESLSNMSPSASNTVKTSEITNKKRTKKQLDPALEAIKNLIERVKWSQVRASLFELMRYTFDLDNASFVRNQMITALKTILFALSSKEFKRRLLNIHMEYLNGDCVAFYVKYVREIIWPNGVIFTSKPVQTDEEKEEQREKAADLLRNAFPDQVSTILGQDNTDMGIEILHEMLQNRVVLKSISYMMMDAVWLEIFPEMDDILTCSSILDHHADERHSVS